MKDSFIRRRSAHYHHEPQELCVSVNGQLQGLQKIVAGRGELTLILDGNEPLGFVEVFSEQGLRLLMLNVEPPPIGEGKQAAHVNLSYGRTIDANLNFSGRVPELQITYNDPALASEVVVETAVVRSSEAAAVAAYAAENLSEVDNTTSLSSPPILVDVMARLMKLFRQTALRSFFQPARVTTALAVLLIAVLLILKFTSMETLAVDLLQRSAEAEETRFLNTDRVLHRTLDIDELSASGVAISHRKIDIWQSSEKGITARRLYDEEGRLVRGDWRQKGGVQTLYAHDTRPILQPLPEFRSSSVTFDNAWQLTVNAKEFQNLVAANLAIVETLPTRYVIKYNISDTGQPGIVQASIILSREDLHATEQTFTLRSGNETRTYHFVETGYDWKLSTTVTPLVFEPNEELTGTASPAESVPRAVARGDLRTNTTASPSAAIATPALEVEFIDSLNNAGALTGEPIEVTRSSDGKIVVAGMVDTDQRKRDLLAALASFKNNPAVQIEIETVADVQTRIRLGKSKQTVTGEVQRFEVKEGESLVYTELKKRFSDAEARRFADSILSRIQSARAHALAMKQISQRFSESDLQSLSPVERTKWISLIRTHAEAFVRESESVLRDLQPFFF